MLKPKNFDNWNRALRGAYRRGHEAGLGGQPQKEQLS